MTDAPIANDSRLTDRNGALAAAFLAIVVHLHALANGFAYDDVVLILGDPRVHSLRDAAKFLAGGYWADPDLGLYRPLTSISFALNYAMAGPQPVAFHAVNILLHAAATALVFALLIQRLPRHAAFAGAAVFAVHPVHVEAVANVVGRGELLAAIFLLAACIVWMRGGPRTRTTRFGVPLLFFFGLLAKESVIVLPALLVLLDAAADRFRMIEVASYVRRNAVAAAGLVLAAVGYFALRAAALPVLTPTRLDPALAVAAPGAERLLTALQAWPEFARLLFLPVTLLADYGPGVITPANGVTTMALVGALLVTGSLLAGAYFFATRHTNAGAAVLWFVIAILPVSSLLIPIGVLVAERTLYIPSVALALGVGAAFAHASRDAARTRAAVFATCAAVILLAVRTAVRVPDWRSTESIFAAQLRDRPDSFRGQWIEAKRLRELDDPNGALTAYARAVHLWPYAPQLSLEAVSYAVELNALPVAFGLAGRIVQARPNDFEMNRILAGIALDVGDSATARTAVERGLAHEPEDELLRRMHTALNVGERQ
jgi:protein O-mannosyl-transferase